MPAEANIESTKKAYAAFNAADAAAAMANLSDDMDWIVPGDSAVSGTYRGKAEVGAFWTALAEKSFTTTPQRSLGDDDNVVVLTHITVGGESAEQADVLTYRDGKVVKFRAIGDTAMQERIYGHK